MRSGGALNCRLTAEGKVFQAWMEITITYTFNPAPTTPAHAHASPPPPTPTGSRSAVEVRSGGPRGGRNLTSCCPLLVDLCNCAAVPHLSLLDFSKHKAEI